MKYFLLVTIITVSLFQLTACSQKASVADPNSNLTDTESTLPAQSEAGEQASLKEVLEQIEGITLIKGNLKLLNDNEDKIESQINTFANQPIKLDSKFITESEESLVENGWEEHKYKVQKDGFYIINSTKQGEKKFTKEEFSNLADKFLKDSNIQGLLDDKKLEYQLKVEESPGLYTAYCNLISNGQETGSYIRLNFENKSICSEAKLHLFKSELLEQLETIPLSTALENAFYIDNDSDGEDVDNSDYSISDIEIKYVNGLPYYSFMASRENSRLKVPGYALAVDISKSSKFEDYKKMVLELFAMSQNVD